MNGEGSQGVHGLGAWELSGGWRFGGPYQPGSEMPGFDDSSFEPVSVPHCVVPLGWRDWEPSDWEKVWVYRRPVELPGPVGDGRWVIDFAGVLSGCTVWFNGAHLVTHLGGYLPFRAELSGHAKPGDNLLAVVVDGRWLNVPPQGGPGGAPTVDFFQPAGIYREVTLRKLPPTSIEDVFAKAQDVLGPGRRLEVTCSVAGRELSKGAGPPPGRGRGRAGEPGRLRLTASHAAAVDRLAPGLRDSGGGGRRTLTPVNRYEPWR